MKETQPLVFQPLTSPFDFLTVENEIIPCFCHFATLIPHFSANLHLCIIPNVPTSTAFSFKVLTSDLRGIATDVPTSAAFYFQRYHKQSA